MSSYNNTIRNVQYGKTIQLNYIILILLFYLEHLIEMLNFNLPESSNRQIWKLFIMDGGAQKILAPLVKVNDLREHGVTLFLQLKSQREKIPDVPAIYFVEPKPESISLICQVIRAWKLIFVCVYHLLFIILYI